MEREKIVELVNKCESELTNEFNKINNLEFIYSSKVLKAMQDNNLSESCFTETTGYGYNDLGRDTIEAIYKQVFNAEDAIVRNQCIWFTCFICNIFCTFRT